MDEIQRQKVQTGLKWGIGLLGAAVLSPFVFLAVKGLVGLALAIVVGLVCVNAAPVISTKLANLKMKEIAREATANPIETLKNDFIAKSNELKKADDAIVEFETETANFDDEVRTFKRQYPDEAPRYQEISETMHKGLQEQKDEQKDARAALQDLSMQIKKAEAIYKMSLAAQRVTSFSQASEQKVFQDIKEKIAFDSVRSNLNRSFASLNMALSKRTERPKLLPEGR